MKKDIHNNELNNKENKKVNRKPFYFFSWILKVEIIIILILLTIFIIYRAIPKTTKNRIKYHFQSSCNKRIESNENEYNNIVSSIEFNMNLEKENKEFIKKYFKKEIEENKDFIDFNSCTKRFKNLKVTYNSRFSKNKYELYKVENSLSIAGSYNEMFNTIDIICNLDNSDESVDFSSCDKESYFHELNHVISKNSFKLPLRINTLSESFNELFTREYYEEYLQDNNINIYVTNGYEKYMKYAYVLAELLPEEAIREYKYNNNESILISKLLEIDNNLDEAYKLIDSINNVKLAESETNEEIENYKNIHDSYSYFYEKKNNKSIKEDILILLYFYNSKVQTEEERNIIRKAFQLNDNDEIINVFAKGYVSQQYKENHDKVVVEIEKNGKREFFEM